MPVYYTYEADVHCPDHAEARFGAAALQDGTAIDNEGNPVGAIFPWDAHEDEACAECCAAAIAARIAARTAV